MKIFQQIINNSYTQTSEWQTRPTLISKPDDHISQNNR